MNGKKTGVKRITAMMLSIALAFGIVFVLPAAPAYADSVIIGQATCGEGGRLEGGRAGDQTGGEVATSGWGYGGAYAWVYVFRAKDAALGKKLAENMKAACANDHIGYDLSSDRTTFYYVAKANDWDIEGITTYCETSCVDCVSVCLNAAGVSVPAAWASKAVYGDLMPTGLFDVYTSSDYTASPANLLPGDILCNPNAPHTAMVVESPNPFYFNVNYKDESGEDQTAKVKDGDSISLNLNNGKAPVSVKIDTSVDLKEYEPERKGSSFNGWEKSEDDTFSANYQSSMMAIKTGGEKKKIK